MMKSLVIVESPAKVKTINKILGDKYKVCSSMGHLIDLPRSRLGVDIKDDFAPHFVVVRKKQKILNQLKKEVKTKKSIYIATDPDREGEAIGWHIVNQLGDGKEVYRVSFHEITKEAVLKAFENPGTFDRKKIDAQVARRILDRIVGYEISPILWKKVGSRLSAGRVQSVALRLIVERERAIKDFIPQEYWKIQVDLKKEEYEDILAAELEKIDSKKFEIKTKDQADEFVSQINKEAFTVSNISQKQVKRKASPPFITSTLQQEAFNKLGFNTNKTMMIAQQLYEGIEVGGGEAVGLITYMRTDSVNIAKGAIEKVRDFIKGTYGEKYLPAKPNKYKSKKSAQEAHEAIRPTDVTQQPKDIRDFLDENQFKLYELIWKRFVSSQMVPAIYQYRKVEINAGRFDFGASGSTLAFDGYLVVEQTMRPKEEEIDFSHYRAGDSLKLIGVNSSQHFTKPPPRYSEASLVKALEEDGIGRPSTYASIIQTLVFRNYVTRDRGYFSAAQLGILICDLLVEYFSKIMDVGFTASMEKSLDLVEEGKLNYIRLLNKFYMPFKEELEYAMDNIEKTMVFTDRKCQQCDKPMTIKWGRKGRFLSCSDFPKCKFAQPFPSGVQCPEPDCGGELVERRSRGGTVFYGCSSYPKCTHTSRKLPESKGAQKSIDKQ